LRAHPGQLFELSDGREVWLAQVEHAGKQEVAFSLVEQIRVTPPALEATLLLAVVKFDRFEWAIEKATELGVAGIVPLAAARSEKGLVAAAPKRARRWEKILVEAAEQSRRLRPPVLQALARDVPRLLQTLGSASGGEASPLLLFFSEFEGAPPLRAVLRTSTHPSQVWVAIGPEGGWTGEERDAAVRAGWAEVSLGANILRTETAVAAALAAINYALGE
jgi:16S rRNA (uracil1498-N3)-methyltransferase